MGKFPVSYMGSLANGICMGGLIPVIVNILILSMDVDIQVRDFRNELTYGDRIKKKTIF